MPAALCRAAAVACAATLFSAPPVQAADAHGAGRGGGAEEPAPGGTEPPRQAPAGQRASPCGDEGDPEACARARRAAEAFERGLRHFAEGRYLEAAAAFAESHAAVPAPATLYNVAVSYEKAGELVRAVETYERYLALAPQDAAMRDRAQRAFEALRAKVGRVVVVDPPSDGSVTALRIDGRKTPVEDFPVYVAPGRVRVDAVSPTGIRHIRTYDVAPGQTVVVNGPALRPPAPVAPRPPQPEVPSRPPPPERGAARRNRLRRAMWGTLGSGLVTGGALTVTGTLALVEARRFNEGKCPEVCTDEDLARYPSFPEVHRRRARALATTTNVLIGVTAALAVTATVLAILARKPRPAAAARHRTGRRPRSR